MLLLPQSPSSPTQILANAFKLWKIHLQDVLLLSFLAILIAVVPYFVLPKLSITFVKDASMFLHMHPIDSGPLRVHFAYLFIYYVLSLYLFATILYRVKMHVTDEMGGAKKAFQIAGKCFGQLLIAAILLNVMLSIGFILFAIPGIYLAVTFSMTMLCIVDDGDNAFTALDNSIRLVKGHWWHTFGTLFLSMFGFFLIVIMVWIMSIRTWVVQHPHGIVSMLYVILSIIVATLYYPLLCATAIVLKEDLKVRQRRNISLNG